VALTISVVGDLVAGNPVAPPARRVGNLPRRRDSSRRVRNLNRCSGVTEQQINFAQPFFPNRAALITENLFLRMQLERAFRPPLVNEPAICCVFLRGYADRSRTRA
jgi:hypothetical protein